MPNTLKIQTSFLPKKRVGWCRNKGLKNRVIEKLKTMLVLSHKAKEIGVKLSEKDKASIENTAKTQLGQTYRNIIVEYLKARGFKTWWKTFN